MMSLRFKLVFFTPKTHTAVILSTLFKQCPNVLGKIGQYEECAFITPGVGQFKPGPGARPLTGEPGKLEYVDEDRVEIVVNDQGDKVQLKHAISHLKAVHPYEEVAYDVYRLEDV
ncbi:GTP cyclohydrolase 1 type 2/Nif3 [Suillus fuscotomentosus]|uniref:ATP phosphoribosyltransferase n=2 Tax=Suillus TaxID=5379 RepID=A0A9P7JUA5_9AGAM|nr:GTP cyclohydrolase 1 type 2/Nif3 [Suillus fuscotomentosus]XP_041293468.1 GTP cyclohydrolase 1 type 2/Nif3 [Suillus discolor]KAG1861848.1 GTP cyclohydrolase 1 type 2/Nif3 [Suillus tomentosus]KAG1900956.1 GTP cyclohydrolase 1 type 2/Nif3 [Suillus fuscotomentosus]KAG2109386.1 GTP cyclohydrolase 1 type 2/Nif3 [Suillus discolor]